MSNTKYNVYYCTPVETIREQVAPNFDDASFDTPSEAISYIIKQVQGRTPFDPRDNTNSNNHHWYEVYKGAPINEDGNLQDPIFTSRIYYND